MADEITTLRRKATAQGFKVETRTSGHLRWTAPDGRFTDTASTPNRGRRSSKNIMAQLRQIGFDPNYVKPRKETQPVSVRDIPDRTPIASAEESSNCTQPGCGKRFLNHKMAEHLLTHGIYSCPDCERTFNAKQALGRHTSVAHGKDAEGNELKPCPFEGCGSNISIHRVALGLHFKKVHKMSLEQWQQGQVAPEPTPTPEVVDVTPAAVEEFLEHAEAVVEASWQHPMTSEVTDETLLAALELLIGKEVSVPMGVIGDVNAWMTVTRNLVGRLR